MLKQIMTSRDIAEAMAYQRIDPHDQTRGDLRAGIIASTVANVHRGRNSKSFSPKDFMPQFGKPKRDAVADKIRAFFK